MKYLDKEEFDKANKFGTGNPNDAFEKYFVGNSFLNPLTNPKDTAVFLANVTFERVAETTGIFITQKPVVDNY